MSIMLEINWKVSSSPPMRVRLADDQTEVVGASVRRQVGGRAWTRSEIADGAASIPEPARLYVGWQKEFQGVGRHSSAGASVSCAS